MNCPHCGTELAGGTRFCPFCGSSIQAKARDPRPSDPRGEQAPYARQPEPGTREAVESTALSSVSPDPLADPRGMKWFKFIIYFQLFASTVLNAMNGIQLVTGSQYEGNAEAVYSYYPGLRSADLLYGVLCFLMAALCLYVRFRLAGFRRNGPSAYYALMFLNVAAALGYMILTSLALNVSFVELLSAGTLGSLLGSVTLLIVNLIYFGKRKDLFVN